MLQRWFLEHPQSAGETYLEHQRTAMGFSAALFVAATACLVHSVIPRLCERTASRSVAALHRRMSNRVAASDRPAARRA